MAEIKPKGFLPKAASALFVTAYWALTLIFFRADGFSNALAMFGNLGFSNSAQVLNMGLNLMEFRFLCWMLAALALVELIDEKFGDRLWSWTLNHFFPLRWAFYIALVLSTIYFGIYGIGGDNNFIYFQF